ncbi:MAG TPA: FKBP-type peptidyl-prolyl cis-trans isomerase [Acidimicrobiales bacterium]|nr:FKBP-type peptidyl-prolyl cis-trans isomerase [Acidimicrobiales bacterium]
MARTSLRSWSVAALIAAGGALGLAACSSSPSNSASGNTTTTSGASSSPATAPPGSPTSAIAPIPAADRSPAGSAGSQPTVTVPSGTPPKRLESTDLITGTGPGAAYGDNVTVQYVLATYSSGKVIQSSWTSQPFSFTIGQGQVIPGWDKGVVGMKAGGRRELIIPPSLGYGAQSPGPGIAANDTLVFVIDLQKIG